jgi:hypothetical protein
MKLLTRDVIFYTYEQCVTATGAVHEGPSAATTQMIRFKLKNSHDHGSKYEAISGNILQ